MDVQSDRKSINLGRRLPPSIHAEPAAVCSFRTRLSTIVEQDNIVSQQLCHQDTRTPSELRSSEMMPKMHFCEGW
jgi:hypothetical protein